MFSNKLKLLRIENRLTQWDLAQVLDVAQGAIANWETGKRTPDIETIQKIANYFKVSVDWLTGKSKYRNENEIRTYNWGINDENFNCAFDFCALIKEIREAYGIPIDKMADAVGVTSEQYRSYEDGTYPITEQQAERFCERLGTNVSQVLFDNGLYSETVPEKYHKDVRQWELLNKAAEDEVLREAYTEILPDNNVYMIPVFESVSAGFGAYACSDVVDYMPLYIKNSADVEDTLCIKVKGDSMFPKIEDGDMIVVRKQSSIDSGQIAVILIDGEEGVVKKVNYGADWIELISINPMYPPRRFEGAEVQRLSVVGLVQQVIKNL